jgi:thioredoxin 1
VAELSRKAPYSGIAQFRVDYDRQKDLMKRFGVRDRSTLIMFKGAKEVGRLYSETDPKVIRALLDKGL